MASGLALLVLVFGVALMLFGYTDLSLCLSLRNIGSSNCWDPFNEPFVDPSYNFAESVIIFYIGIIVAISGAVLLVGGDVARLFGKLRGRGPA